MKRHTNIPAFQSKFAYDSLIMFCNRVFVTPTKSLVLSELQSAGSLSTNPVKAHGILWKFLFLWQNGRIECKVGLDQALKPMRGVAIRACLVVQSNSARLRRTSDCLLACTEAQHSICSITINASEIELLGENGVLKISAFLEVFQPISFRTISKTAKYSLSVPPECMAIVGTDHQGSVYVLCSLSVLSPGVEQWGVYSFRPCNPDRAVILARFNMRPACFRGSGFDPENKRLTVTTQSYVDNSLQLDILDWESGHHSTRIYSIQEDQDLNWSAATPHKEGWLCIASGVRTHPRMVYHRFWLLGEDGRLKLLTELVQATPLKFVYPAASLNGKFYCMVATRGVRYLIFVSSWEKPDIWQPYEMAPYPYFYILKFYLAWGHMVLVGKVTSSGPDHSCIQQNALFKLRFDGADCLIEPYIILPNKFHDWIIGGDAFLGFDVYGNKNLSVLPVQPISLKMRALLDVGEQLKGRRRAGKKNKKWRNIAKHTVRILT